MRRNLTLVEILLVIALIGVISSVLVFAFPMGLREEQFNKSLFSLQNKIDLAEEIMLDYDTDVTLLLGQEEKGISCHIYPAKKLPDPLLRSINRETFLKGIEKIVWQERVYTTLHLRFSWLSPDNSRGELQLEGKKEALLNLGTQNEPKTHYPQEFLSAA